MGNLKPKAKTILDQSVYGIIKVVYEAAVGIYEVFLKGFETLCEGPF